MTYIFCSIVMLIGGVILFFFKQKTAYEMRISDWSSDVCSSDLPQGRTRQGRVQRLKRVQFQQCGQRRTWPDGRRRYGTGCYGDLVQFARQGRIAFARRGAGPDGIGVSHAIGQAWREHETQAAADRKSTRLNSSH